MRFYYYYYFFIPNTEFPIQLSEVQDRNIQPLISEILRFCYVVLHQNNLLPFEKTDVVTPSKHLNPPLPPL